MTPRATTSTEGRELILTRIIDAPRDKVFRAWTEPELLKQWFAPLPWTTSKAETDTRAGGASLIVMRSPEGNEFPSRGVYLEVVQNERLVFTDAFTKDWEPSEKPFMTLILTFEEIEGKPDILRGCAIGRWPTARPTRRWVSTLAGSYAPSNLRRLSRGFDLLAPAVRLAWEGEGSAR